MTLGTSPLLTPSLLVPPASPHRSNGKGPPGCRVEGKPGHGEQKPPTIRAPEEENPITLQTLRGH